MTNFSFLSIFKTTSLHLPVDLEACPVGKEGIWRNLIHLCMSIPTGRDSLGVWGVGMVTDPQGQECYRLCPNG